MERHIKINKRQRIKDLCSIEDIPTTEKMWGQCKKSSKEYSRNWFMQQYYCNISYSGGDGHKEMHSRHSLPDLLMDKLRREYDQGYSIEVYDTDNDEWLHFEDDIEIRVRS